MEWYDYTADYDQSNTHFVLCFNMEDIQKCRRKLVFRPEIKFVSNKQSMSRACCFHASFICVQDFVDVLFTALMCNILLYQNFTCQKYFC